MNETLDMAERRSALDAFASAVEGPTQALAVQMPPAIAPHERVFGAQPVAVHRDERAILQKLTVLAAAAGTEWYYRWPVENRKTGRLDWVEGPSIKLANDLARIYGNCDVDVRVVDLGDSWLFYARFTDLETGFTLTRPFQQRKSQKTMQTDDAARKLDIVFQIGVSKAIRNVVVDALQTFADFAFEEAKNAITEKVGKKLDHYRGKVLERLTSMGIEVARVEATVGRASRDWLTPDVARIIAELQAIQDGMTAADMTYPPLKGDAQPPAEVAKKDLEKFAEGEQQQAAQGNPAQDQNAPEENPAEKGVEADPQSDGAVRPQAASTPQPAQSQEATAEDDDPAAYGLDPLLIARQRGWQAREDGSGIKAVPPRYREKGREAELRAWQEGHKDNAAGKSKPE